MKIINIETRKNLKKINLKKLDKLPGKKISLAATIQYLDLVPKIKKYLEDKNKKVIIKKGAKHKAHVLGCNSKAFDKNIDTLLLLADGKFHALNLASVLKKPIYIFNTQKIEKLTKKQIQNQIKKTKAKQKIFLTSEKIGILISTKPGQRNNIYNNLAKKIKKLNKQVYVFQADTINITELDNFPQVQIWINTACPGLALDDNRIINYQDILEFLG